jgi:hypothetical protein
MEASTSSGAIDERRKNALKTYRDVGPLLSSILIYSLSFQKMRAHEASSESLKNRACFVQYLVTV